MRASSILVFLALPTLNAGSGSTSGSPAVHRHHVALVPAKVPTDIDARFETLAITGKFGATALPDFHVPELSEPRTQVSSIDGYFRRKIGGERAPVPGASMDVDVISFRTRELLAGLQRRTTRTGLTVTTNSTFSIAKAGVNAAR